MEDNVTRRKRLSGLALLVGGALLYLISLWPGCETLSEKGYFFATLVLSGFSLLVRQEHTGNERLLNRCKYLLFFATGMLLVGLWNVTLPIAAKIFSLLGLGVSLYGTNLYASFCDEKSLRVN